MVDCDDALRGACRLCERTAARVPDLFGAARHLCLPGRPVQPGQ
ncbi:hypothetical protein VARIO8X_70076 [Burkholderiales bacterium 8X]|nr:hypothetical protein VARIO8X_70076 [Burkholderiales bacterium 8X]